MIGNRIGGMSNAELQARLRWSQLGDNIQNVGGMIADPLLYANDLNTRASKSMINVGHKGINHIGKGYGRGALRMAMRSPHALTAMKIATPIAALNAVGGVADIALGQDSGWNKAMDAAAMGVGGFLGSVGGPLGIAAGAGTGKAVSDGLQWLFGDKKTAQQRKMEEALALLKAGVI